MARCKWCSKKGFFLKLTVDGLCEKCHPIILKTVNDNKESLKKNINALMNYITPKEGLVILSAIQYSLNLLEQYEKKGIPTISPTPKDLLKRNIYGSYDETIVQIEKRLICDNDKFCQGILNLDCTIHDIKLKGDFIYDSYLGGYAQICTKPLLQYEPNSCRHEKKVMIYSEDFKSGVYREYYLSGRLRREIPFIKESDFKWYRGHGTEKLFYEDLDSYGEETYTILEENFFNKGKRCGIWKRYSIDGGLMEETDFDKSITTNDTQFSGNERKEYYPASGKLKLEEYENWGKEYYEDGRVKAEWNNKNFMKFGKYIGYHRNGRISMTANYIDGIHRDGLMHKYFENGEIGELWNYNNGKRVFVKKYHENRVLKTEWLYDKDGNEVSKSYFDENGKLKRKN